MDTDLLTAARALAERGWLPASQLRQTEINT